MNYSFINEYTCPIYGCQVFEGLVSTHKPPRQCESGLLDECALQILRCAQDDSQGVCHPERSEGSLADLWGITSLKREGR